MCNPQHLLQPNFSYDQAFKRLALKQQQFAEILLEQMASPSSQSSNARALSHQQRLKELARIIGGVPAIPGEFNECCLIGQRSQAGTYRWFCTGILVHSRTVITAAHCIRNGGAYVVSLSTNNEKVLNEVIPTRKAIVHPQYARINDIAVLVLQADAKTSPVALASEAEIRTANEVELVGFGNNDILSEGGFGLKRKVSVDMVSVRRDPSEDLNTEEMTYGFESDLEFVAGGNGFDTCNGDSGGPVYILKETGRVLAGLTSRATDNATNPCGDGGIYTRVDVHQQFIESFF